MIMLIIIGLTIAFFVWLFLSGQQSKDHQRTQLEIAGYDHDALMRDAEMMKLRVEVLIQSEVVGDTSTHDAVMNDSYDGPWPELRSDGAYLSLYDNLRILKIAGINYRSGISRYVGRVNCALVPEPNNEYDPDAIKVVAEDRHHLGYIASDQTDFVRSLTGEKFPYRCLAVIDEREDEMDGHKFYDGRIYIKRHE